MVTFSPEEVAIRIFSQKTTKVQQWSRIALATVHWNMLPVTYGPLTDLALNPFYRGIYCFPLKVAFELFYF